MATGIVEYFSGIFMENTQNIIAHKGIGFGGLLTILFIGLKLTNYISWSWWWVLSPLWIPISLVFLMACFVFIVAFVVALIK